MVKLRLWAAAAFLSVLFCNYATAAELPDNQNNINPLLNKNLDIDAALQNAINAGGDIKKINTLIQKGADVNKLSEEGLTPLAQAMILQYSIFAEMSAAAFKNKTEINEVHYLQKTEKTILPVLELLLRSGADINGLSTAGTPLHIAASGSSPVILYYLLDKGADPNIRDTEGNTPLFSAANANKIQNIEILLKFGAHPEIRNKDGRTYSDYLTHKIFRYKH